MQQKTEQSTSSVDRLPLPHSEHSAYLGVGVVDDAIYDQPYTQRKFTFYVAGKNKNDTIWSETQLSAVAIRDRAKPANSGKSSQRWRIIFIAHKRTPIRPMDMMDEIANWRTHEYQFLRRLRRIFEGRGGGSSDFDLEF